MRDFLESIPANFWGFKVMFIVALLSLIYVVYYFLSQEGRDERGRGIFASASVVTFSLLLVVLLASDLLMEGAVSYKVFSFFIFLLVTIMTTCQASFILIFRKIK